MSAAQTENVEHVASSVEENKSDEEPTSFVPYRIFINYVDNFNAQHISSYLADQYYGEKKKEEYIPIEGEGASPEDEASKMDIDERNKYQIIGTLSSLISKKSEDVMYVVDELAENFREEINNCGIIIYDITRNSSVIPKAINTLKELVGQLDELKQIGPKTYSNHPKNQIFILISTIMTWARTKKTFMEEPGPFIDSHYRRRKPHLNYKEYLECEREVIMLGKRHKKKLKTYVLATGFTYGFQEESMDFFFKLAWSNSQHLPIFGNGSNFIPLIHVSDLARIVGCLIKNPPSLKRYILAVEPVSAKLSNIVKAISKGLGKGYVKEVQNLEEAMSFNGITERIYDQFTVNLKMEPVNVAEIFQMEWQYESGFVRSIIPIIEELKESRELSSIKIMIHGPPGSGKTILAKRICELYGLHYVSIKTLIEETLQNLRDNITEEKLRLKIKQEREAQRLLAMEENEEDMNEEEEEEEVEEEEEEGVGIEEWEEQIRDIQSVLSESEDNKLPDEQVNKLLRIFLNSNICQNQGFVLDGYPKTIEQAEELFGRTGEDEEEESPGEGEADDYEERFAAIANSKIMPQHVFSLVAPDEFLCERIKKQQEKDIEGTHYTEEHMKRRLEAFRQINTEDETILNFYDEMEIHPILYDATKDTTENMDLIFNAVKQIIGNPVSFGFSLEEQLKIHEMQEMEYKKRIKSMEAKKKAEEEEALENYKLKMTKWTETLEALKSEEEKVVIAESEPLRNYLMEFIFPTLTKALTEVVKIKPDDPVDFVAEYLFKINPEAKLFDPTFSQKGQELLTLCHDAVASINTMP
ncbi:adenylate kinase 7-like [Coccinella septempunctata]|uniref:adenylate kinase 7-like n=1 Tax=Coccinella septempunctata TaxID=41139 RepID=UPI001D09124F|nr:adenylate kinase 7-like [Coccinella septempunctata]